jgi:hypothetical protein
MSAGAILAAMTTVTAVQAKSPAAVNSVPSATMIVVTGSFSALPPVPLSTTCCDARHVSPNQFSTSRCAICTSTITRAITDGSQRAVAARGIILPGAARVQSTLHARRALRQQRTGLPQLGRPSRRVESHELTLARTACHPSICLRKPHPRRVSCARLAAAFVYRLVHTLPPPDTL